MKVIHLSAECYPVAKTGGLGDVVGALPKYQNLSGLDASVVMPYYRKNFVENNSFETVFESSSSLGTRPFSFQILKETHNVLGFPLYLVHIPNLLDRPEVYGYPDETEQFVAFQLAFLEWAAHLDSKPDIIHCHDHHAGLVPFLMYNSYRYRALQQIPTVVTVHNAEYQGWFSWNKAHYLPDVDRTKLGLLDWNGTINPLASAIKCSWRFTTVSPSYLKDLSLYSNGLEYLFAAEKQKGIGILNGIDYHVWDPAIDPMIPANFSADNVETGKQENKISLFQEFELDADKPLIAFIGRLVGEKGADLLPGIIRRSLMKYHGKANFLVLGSGERTIEEDLTVLWDQNKKSYNQFIGYNETLSHRIYASADFLLMPSKVEPCGLNQFYSMRYGTVPIVRGTGGLKDTVIDLDSENGYGICFDNLSAEEAVEAVGRAVDLFSDTSRMQFLRKRMMALDFSWDTSATQYINLYKSIIS